MSAEKRNGSLDLLRILSTIAVVLIHCNAHYFADRASQINGDIQYCVESFLNIITRFSVPAFVMISGAFILANGENKNHNKFYMKSLYKIYLPLVPIMLGYFLLNSILAVKNGQSIAGPVMTLVTGGGFYNLWFMYMLFGLYLLAPFIVIVKSTVSEKVFCKASVVFLIWGCVSQVFSNQTAAHSIGVVMAFLSYFMIGNVIYERCRIKPVKHPAACFGAAFLCFVLSFIARYKGIAFYVFDAYKSFFSPPIIIASVLIFAGFCSLRIERDFTKLSSLTFYIYLFHALIYTVLFKWIDRYPGGELGKIAVVTVLTFFIALCCAVAYKALWGLVTKRLLPFEKWKSFKIWS